MAYPAIENTFSGTEVTDALHHEITIPSGITAGNLIAIFVSVIGTSETNLGYGIGCGINIVGYVSTPNWKYELGGDAGVVTNNVNLLYCISNGSGLDAVTVRSQTWYRNALNVRYWDILYPCMVSYVGYVISGHGVTSGDNPRFRNRSTSGNISNWITNSCPSTDDSLSDDYLWILGVCATDNNIATVQPTGFSTLTTAQGLNVATATSTSACYRQYNSVTQYPQTSFTAPVSAYDSMLVRIPSGAGSTYTGFGIYVPSGAIGLP